MYQEGKQRHERKPGSSKASNQSRNQQNHAYKRLRKGIMNHNSGLRSEGERSRDKKFHPARKIALCFDQSLSMNPML
jgi:hypothetical protein